MPRIFISYRREDSIAYAGRIYDRLILQFGTANVFMDIDSLEPGVDFVEALRHTVASCDVLLAVLGRHWLTIKDAQGRPRLSNPEDFIVLEIRSALDKPNIRVVPILVGGARMPRPADLPEELSRLTRLQALELADIGFHQTLGRLIESMERDERELKAREEAEAARRAEEERQKRETAAKEEEERQQREAAGKAEKERQQWEVAGKAEQERIDRETAEATRRQARWKTEAEQLAQDKARAEEKARTEQERIDREKTRAARRQARWKAEAEQLAQDKARAEEQARAERERINREKADATRRQARWKAEAEQLAQDKARAQGKTRTEQDDAQHEKAAKAERERQQREAAVQAEQDRTRGKKKRVAVSFFAITLLIDGFGYWTASIGHFGWTAVALSLSSLTITFIVLLLSDSLRGGFICAAVSFVGVSSWASYHDQVFCAALVGVLSLVAIAGAFMGDTRNKRA
jgi:hypothetical protein